LAFIDLAFVVKQAARGKPSYLDASQPDVAFGVAKREISLLALHCKPQSQHPDSCSLELVIACCRSLVVNKRLDTNFAFLAQLQRWLFGSNSGRKAMAKKYVAPLGGCVNPHLRRTITST
jgi:hypothetical protein